MEQTSKTSQSQSNIVGQDPYIRIYTWLSQHPNEAVYPSPLARELGLTYIDTVKVLEAIAEKQSHVVRRDNGFVWLSAEGKKGIMATEPIFKSEKSKPYSYIDPKQLADIKSKLPPASALETTRISTKNATGHKVYYKKCPFCSSSYASQGIDKHMLRCEKNPNRILPKPGTKRYARVVKATQSQAQKKASDKGMGRTRISGLEYELVEVLKSHPNEAKNIHQWRLLLPNGNKWDDGSVGSLLAEFARLPIKQKLLYKVERVSRGYYSYTPTPLPVESTYRHPIGASATLIHENGDEALFLVEDGRVYQGRKMK